MKSGEIALLVALGLAAVGVSIFLLTKSTDAAGKPPALKRTKEEVIVQSEAQLAAMGIHRTSGGVLKTVFNAANPLTYF